MTRLLRTVKTSFQSGEIDPKLHGRIDLDLYRQGAAALHNAQIMDGGGVTRRPGAERMDVTASLYLWPFDFDSDERYLISLGPQTLEVLNLGCAILHGEYDPADCPWTAEHLPFVSVAQRGDVAVITSAFFFPRVLRRTGLSDFTIGPIVFDDYGGKAGPALPFYRYAPPDLRLKVAATSGTGIACTASAAFFEAGYLDVWLKMLGGYLLVTAVTDATHATVTIRGTLREILGLNPFRTQGGTKLVEVTHVAHGLADGTVVTFSGVNAVGGLSSADIQGARTITVLDENRYTFVSTSASNATSSADGGGSNVALDAANLFTSDWQESAFTAVRGFPRTCVFHQNRLAFGGNDSLPDFVWMSRADSYFDFDLREGGDGDSIQKSIGTNAVAEIRRLASERELLAFTGGGVFSLSHPTNAGLTPGNARWRMQTNVAASYVRPAQFDGTVMYVQETLATVRQMTWSDGGDGWDTQDVSVLAGHLIRNPVDLVALMGTPELPGQLVAVVNNDGTLAVLHSNKAEKTAGWAEWELSSAKALGACAIASRLYLIVERSPGSRAFYRMASDDQRPMDDHWVSHPSVPAVAVTLPGIYRGGTWELTIDDWSVGEVLVPADGVLALPATALRQVLIGRSYPTQVLTLPPVFDLPDGPSFGRKMRIVEVAVRVQGAKALRMDGEQMYTRVVVDDVSVAEPPIDGLYVFGRLGWEREPRVSFDWVDPLPGRILSLTMKVSV